MNTRLLSMVAAVFTCWLPLGAQAASPVHEAEFVKIGGIEQWITITGEDSANPVLLFLHGGPGAAETPSAEMEFSGWDKDFTVVQWDQRGAGRTFGKTGPAIEPTMTIDRMTQDGIEVATYLSGHLHKKKIILVGASWGSILGTHMVHARPDLFSAYVGMAQVVSMQKIIAASYQRTLAMARAANDTQAITELTALGPPPWNVLSAFGKMRKWEQPDQKKLETAPHFVDSVAPAYASAPERAQWAAAQDFNWVHWIGLKMDGPLMQDDLVNLGPDFSMPVFIIQGEVDLTAPVETARAYFDSIKAPRKTFIIAPGTGHAPTVPIMSLTHKILLEQVRPLAVAAEKQQ